MFTAPPLRRRIIGGALRRYRENLGYTLDDAARILECDRSKVSRIETGQRGIRGKELRDLLTEYGIDGQQQAILGAMADPRGARGRYGTYADVLPEAWQDYLLLETAASRILAYEAQRIPALLQTPDYARALAETDPGLADDDARDRAVEATLTRQNAILGERKPDIHLIIGEAALHQAVGGPEVMEAQFGLLAGVSGDSGVITVQILPFSSGAHAASGDRRAGHPPVLGGTRAWSCSSGRRRRGRLPGRTRATLPFTPACSSSLELSCSAPRSPRACSEGRRPHSTYAVRRHRPATRASGIPAAADHGGSYRARREPVTAFFRDLLAAGCSEVTVRSYGTGPAALVPVHLAARAGLEAGDSA